MKQEYRLTRNWKIIYSIRCLVFFSIFLLYLIPAIFSWIDPSFTAWGANSLFRQLCFYPGLISIFALTAFQNLHYVYFEKMVLSDDGIEYHSLGASIVVSWADLKKIEKCRWTLENYDGILVPEKNIKHNILGYITDRVKHIPLYLFDKNWRTSELGQQIKQHAPQLFSSVEN